MTATLSLQNSSMLCVPRWATTRTESRRTVGPEIARVAEQFGQPLMPWQQMIADVAGEMIGDLPAYREVIISVPRQSGKTTLVLAWECHRALMWGRAQRITYTAQTGEDARKKLIDDQGPLVDPESPLRTPLSAGVKRIFRGAGASSIDFLTGSRIVLISSGKAGGHGKTSDLAVIDEAFADSDDRREQALVPAMLTRADAQVLILSTMGTEESVYWNRKVATGRESVANGLTEGVAYFEWSADPDLPIDSPSTWYSCMPALGHTQGEPAVRHALETMTEGEFRRAMLNQRTISDERVIPVGTWNAVCNERVEPIGTLTFALDVNPERSGAAICVADGSGACEMVKSAEGLGWVVEACQTLSANGSEVVVDKRSPAASLIPELQMASVNVVEYDTTEVTRACGGLYDAVADQKIRIRRNPVLDEAVAGASKRQSGDAWMWARRDSGSDVSALVALTLAFDRATKHEVMGDPWILIR